MCPTGLAYRVGKKDRTLNSVAWFDKENARIWMFKHHFRRDLEILFFLEGLLFCREGKLMELSMFEVAIKTFSMKSSDLDFSKRQEFKQNIIKTHTNINIKMKTKHKHLRPPNLFLFV